MLGKKKELIEFRERFVDKNFSRFTGSEDSNYKLDFSNTRISSISSKVLYENISFYKAHFRQCEFKEICFYNCSFTFCTFEDIATDIMGKHQQLRHNVVFEKCRFSYCNFIDCLFVFSIFSKCTFNVGEFKNMEFRDVIFNLCSLSHIRFKEGAILEHTFFLSPSGFFDIRFEKCNKPYLIDSASGVTRFDYRDTRHIDNTKKKKVFRRNAYKDVADTLYAFKQLFAENHIYKTSIDYYFLYKKADTRSSHKFLKRFNGYISEWISGYGTKPSNALFSIIIISFFYAPVYMISGFSIGERTIKYTFDLTQLFVWNVTKIKDLFESWYFSFFTLCTVGQGSSIPISDATKIISSTELFVGAILITIFVSTLFKKITE